MLCVCVPCLLKAASVKDESEEVQTEVEIALMALSDMGFFEIGQELYLKEITEIVKHQQKHRNLTKLAYHLEDTITAELHFGREAARELEELARCIDWKKKEEMNKEETKEEFALMRWLKTCEMYFLSCRLWNEENVELINSIVHLYRAAKGNNGVICNRCIHFLRNASDNRVVKVEDLLKGGAVDTVLEGMQQPTLDDNVMRNCLYFFLNVSKRLKRKTDDELEEVKGKELNRKVFEKLEEEGYEDAITSFHKIFEFLNQKYYDDLSLSISDYLVNV
ncbi:uncharacterized protein MONOS_10882 [Monocercomonoides exilis]|uniref:uncharacterized protein n=1 Tax=Monocercomonoides exilis TaxID=2049356 RepID=UPI003559BA01|nr:hypothetical protein MONOS_10882 [Monocercomonoides exilis]|eukprot:MONOS_10882.1-p1 / transcript=MONOS_10882.1 / gene=MONOS_10882 / organism=Monocercomonoides_exilis_PA203 / gene_product=unspecified product / transcript_product=unspecified product / location=Mono_scaffold00514:42868-43810(-) / protein_length=278 / sequence_SO=supercontig / SO=protein_coding / is_pseudo=false